MPPLGCSSSSSSIGLVCAHCLAPIGRGEGGEDRTIFVPGSTFREGLQDRTGIAEQLGSETI